MAKAFKKKFVHSEETENSFVTEKKNGHLKVVEGGCKVVSRDDSKELSISDEQILKDFDLKSEYTEKNVKIKSPSKEELEAPVQTNIIVYKENDDVETIKPKDLKNLIKKNKDIKQVIVEKISVNDATRISMLYRPKEETAKKVERTEKTLPAKNTSAPNLSLVETESVSLPAAKSGKSFDFTGLERRANRAFLSDAGKQNVSGTPLFRKEGQSSSDEINFSLKEREELGKKVDKRLSYSKHTLTRKKGKVHNGFYYRVKDHMELFKVGSSFLKDFKDGVKNFSFNSFGLKQEQEKTVFGISSFFNYHTEVKQLIIADGLENTFYKEFVGEFEHHDIQVFDENFTFRLYVGKGFDYLELTELGKVERKLKDYDFEDFLDEFSESYDLILWDLPSLEVLDGRKELFFPIVRMLDSVSFIVKGDKTKMSQIEEMMAYFQKYQIKIKGLLFSSPEKEAK